MTRPGPRRLDLVLSRRGKLARTAVLNAVATSRDHLPSRLDYFLIDHTALACVHNLDCAEYLANLGNLSESAAVLRQALEKVALLAEILSKGENFEFASGMKSVWNVRHLKAEFPKIGNLYGLLSSYVHWSPIMHLDVIAKMGENVGVMKASSPFKVTALLLSSTCHLTLLRLAKLCIEPMLIDKNPAAEMQRAEEGLVRSTVTSIKRLKPQTEGPALWTSAAVMFLQSAGRL